VYPFVTDNRKGNFVFVRFFCIFTPTNKFSQTKNNSIMQDYEIVSKIEELLTRIEALESQRQDKNTTSMPKKRTEPRGLVKKIAKILGLRENYISGVLSGNVGASDERVALIAAAKEQARQEVEMDIKVRAAKKAAKKQMLQNA